MSEVTSKDPVAEVQQLLTEAKEFIGFISEITQAWDLDKADMSDATLRSISTIAYQAEEQLHKALALSKLIN